MVGRSRVPGRNCAAHRRQCGTAVRAGPRGLRNAAPDTARDACDGGRARGALARQSGDAKTAREMAGRAAALVLAFVGSLPLWLGPRANCLPRANPWIIDAAIGMSPLIHLAVASGNDLLRNQWFYQHSNLAALQFSYPSLGGTCPVLRLGVPGAGACPAGMRRPRRRIDGATPTPTPTEQAT